MSPRQVGRGLPGTVTRALAANGVPAGRLGIEITENGVSQRDRLQPERDGRRARALGIDILVRRLRHRLLGSEQRDGRPRHRRRSSTSPSPPGSADGGPRGTGITSTVATRATSLSRHGVAEGVETVEQAERLRQHGWKSRAGLILPPARPAPAGSRGLDAGAASAPTVGVRTR